MTKMSQGNKKITIGKIPVINNKILVHTGILIPPALFQEILITSYKIILSLCYLVKAFVLVCILCIQ